MSAKIKVKLSKKVKYNGERNSAGSEIEIDEKDLEFFKDNDLISEVMRKQKKEETQKQSKEKLLEEKTVTELYDIAQELDIEGRTKLRNDRKELLAAVKEALAEKDGE
jgi:hypothetical protein